MRHKTSYISVLDCFCGAGGSSTGMAAIPGVEVVTAINHWDLALESHNSNHPNTEHICTDISTSDPRKIPATTAAWFSPECTNHSISKGKKRASGQQLLPGFGEKGYDPSAERSRMTAWDVVRYTEEHKYQFVIVENVVDFRRWVLYDAWFNAMKALGYRGQPVYFNSMFAGVPQSRNRMYIVFWRHNNLAPDLSFAPLAMCERCGDNVHSKQAWKKEFHWGSYKKQYIYICPDCRHEVVPYYNPAWMAIDWDIESTPIGERARPLAENTMKRIRAGIEKYWVEPTVIDLAYTHSNGVRSTSVTEPFPTQTTRQTQALCQPFLTQFYTRQSAHSPIDEAIPTITGDLRHGLIEPFIAEMRKHSTVRTTREPLSTIATSGAHHGLVQYYGTGGVTHISEAIPTITTKERHALLTNMDQVIEQCGFRMLSPNELKVGMGFPNEYIVLRNNKQQVKQLGNAVTSPVATLLVSRCVEALSA